MTNYKVRDENFKTKKIKAIMNFNARLEGNSHQASHLTKPYQNNTRQLTRSRSRDSWVCHGIGLCVHKAPIPNLCKMSCNVLWNLEWKKNYSLNEYKILLVTYKSLLANWRSENFSSKINYEFKSMLRVATLVYITTGKHIVLPPCQIYIVYITQHYFQVSVPIFLMVGS